MSKKRLLILSITVLLTFLLVGAVYAQVEVPPQQSQGDGDVPEWNRGGFGHHGGFGRHGVGMVAGEREYGPLHEAMVAAFAEVFGIEQAELESRLAEGETMFEIAEASGISAEEFRSIMFTTREEAINLAVEQGLLSPEQAEWMLERMEAMEQEGYGPGSGHCDGSGPGRGGNVRRGGGRFSPQTP